MHSSCQCRSAFHTQRHLHSAFSTDFPHSHTFSGSPAHSYSHSVSQPLRPEGNIHERWFSGASRSQCRPRSLFVLGVCTSSAVQHLIDPPAALTRHYGRVYSELKIVTPAPAVAHLFGSVYGSMAAPRSSRTNGRYLVRYLDVCEGDSLRLAGDL